MKSDTQILVVDASQKDLFSFLAVPENLPKWAVKFCHTFRPRNEEWWCWLCLYDPCTIRMAF
jgi:hypothetical protein